MTSRAILVLVAVVLGGHPLRADDWPQWRGPQRDGVWRETGIIEKFDRTTLKPIWTAPVGPGFSGPTVAGDRVFLMDRATRPVEQERVLCFARATGRPLWNHAYACRYHDVDYALGPRAAVTIADGRAFAFGTMGDACCLDVGDGHVIWARNLLADYHANVPGWGMSGAPLVARDVVVFQIGAEPDACLVALDVRSGRERWHALDGGASYSAPRLARLSDRDVVLTWTARWFAALDVATGAAVWKIPYQPSRWVHNVADPALDETGQHALLTSFYDGTLYFRIAGAGAPELLWRRTGVSERRTEALHALNATPFIRTGHAYGTDSFGELRGVELTQGERVWENTTLLRKARWATAHLVQNGDRTWITDETGDIIVARLTPRGAEELSRAKFIEADTSLVGRDELVTWAHPAYAHRCLFARNDAKLVCISLAAGDDRGEP